MDNNFKEMLCPVCGKYLFTDDTELEKSDPDYQGKEIDWCIECGWRYDLSQTEDPDLKEGNNKLSLNEYKKWYQKKLLENPDFNYLDENHVKHPHLCPVCGKHTFSDDGSFEICPVCGWEDDGIMEREPDRWAGTANDLCLNDFKKRYEGSIGKN